jgi:hypothetical protein
MKFEYKNQFAVYFALNHVSSYSYCSFETPACRSSFVPFL